MNQRIASVNDYKDVTNVVAKYIEAIQIGNIALLSVFFHKDAVTYGTVDGKLVGGSSNPAVDFIKNYGSSPELNYNIDVLDITPTTAVARVVTEKDAFGADCSEFLTLIKIDEKWAIIAKAFHQFDQSVASA